MCPFVCSNVRLGCEYVCVCACLSIGKAKTKNRCIKRMVLHLELLLLSYQSAQRIISIHFEKE